MVRERKRVAWILLLLALIFAVCWLPYNSIALYNDVTDAQSGSLTLSQYLLLLGHTNSALNPIIYCVMSKNFRRSVKDIIFKTRINFQDRQNLRLRVSTRYATFLESYNALLKSKSIENYQKCWGMVFVDLRFLDFAILLQYNIQY